MVAHLKEYVRRALDGNGYLGTQVRELNKELRNLDLRDFEPSARVDFMTCRGLIGSMAQRAFDQQEGTKVFQDLQKALDGYKGEGSRAATRQFDFVSDADLKRIVERDYAELTLKVFPDEAWKSSVILAGSVLEAILYDVLSEPTRIGPAKASATGAKQKGKLEDGEWTLAALISIAEEIKVLTRERARTIDQVLRDYRNFVHPKKEIRAAHECSESEAMLAVGALNAICDHFEKTL